MQDQITEAERVEAIKGYEHDISDLDFSIKAMAPYRTVNGKKLTVRSLYDNNDKTKIIYRVTVTKD